jgi:Xaa-Pro aminopeptidase
VIVAAWRHSASPHHQPANTVIESGDPVVVDIAGTMSSGYRSDCTRTYVLGQPPAGFLSYYNVLHQAQRAAVAAVMPGVTAAGIDAVARDMISDAGYGPSFVHRTGHGIGLDTHEPPYIVSTNPEPLAEGMVFSVEPGIYLTDQHGARIEDIVVCTRTGPHRLTTTSPDLVHL